MQVQVCPPKAWAFSLAPVRAAYDSVPAFDFRCRSSCDSNNRTTSEVCSFLRIYSYIIFNIFFRNSITYVYSCCCLRCLAICCRCCCCCLLGYLPLLAALLLLAGLLLIAGLLLPAAAAAACVAGKPCRKNVDKFPLKVMFSDKYAGYEYVRRLLSRHTPNQLNSINNNLVPRRGKQQILASSFSASPSHPSVLMPCRGKPAMSPAAAGMSLPSSSPLHHAIGSLHHLLYFFPVSLSCPPKSQHLAPAKKQQQAVAAVQHFEACLLRTALPGWLVAALPCRAGERRPKKNVQLSASSLSQNTACLPCTGAGCKRRSTWLRLAGLHVTPHRAVIGQFTQCNCHLQFKLESFTSNLKDSNALKK